MKRRIKIASIILYITSTLILLMALLLFFGVVVRGALLPPMEEMIGFTTEELNDINPSIVKFIITPISVVSALLLTLSVGLFIMIKGPFKNQVSGARKTIFTMLTIWLVLADVIAFSAFPHGPWPVWSLCTILTIIAYVVSQPKSSDL